MADVNRSTQWPGIGDTSYGRGVTSPVNPSRWSLYIVARSRERRRNDGFNGRPERQWCLFSVACTRTFASVSLRRAVTWLHRETGSIWGFFFISSPGLRCGWSNRKKNITEDGWVYKFIIKYEGNKKIKLPATRAPVHRCINPSRNTENDDTQIVPFINLVVKRPQISRIFHPLAHYIFSTKLEKWQTK